MKQMGSELGGFGGGWFWGHILDLFEDGIKYYIFFKLGKFSLYFRIEFNGEKRPYFKVIDITT